MIAILSNTDPTVLRLSQAFWVELSVFSLLLTLLLAKELVGPRPSAAAIRLNCALNVALPPLAVVFVMLFTARLGGP